MCLATVALNSHPDFPFICIANRDEFHNRPTEPLQATVLPGGIELWAGKDLQSGGSWLGLGSNGEFALLTNVRNAELNLPGTAPTRGELVVNAIQTGKGPTQTESLQYAGFNLIHGNLNQLKFHCISNQGPKLGNNVTFSSELPGGVHGLSNGHLDAPWPKTSRLKEGLRQEINLHCDAKLTRQCFENSLFDLLAHTGLANDSELPSTGVPYEWEKMLSAVKIVSPVYGTRSSAVVLLDQHNIVHFTEITFNPTGNEIGRQRFEIPLPPKL